MSEAKKAAGSGAASSAKKTAASSARTRKKKAARAQVTQGKVFVQATFNNTIVSITDNNGNVLGWCSAGVVGFKGPKKATPYAASMIVKEAVEKTKDSGLKDVNVYVSGVGQGREGAIRALNANGLNVLSIKDVTPIPHNGCRAPRPRRV
ncbi:30S ribosomal protein S11 [Patescibacteria group bacterium]|jgi:small subunit ribosomal protein S11|nr:30S ribosomal protein S11 [Patescibacteria group bacterium]